MTTLTSLGLKGNVNSPCRKPFFSKNTMSCLFGLLCVDAIKFPMGLGSMKLNCFLHSHAMITEKNVKKLVLY